MSNFVHLHCHSHYSLLDGLAAPKELIDKAIKLNMSAIALTDHGNLFGAIDFYTACMERGIKPIIGYEAYVAPTACTEKKSKKGDLIYYHLTILAENNTGYQNLIQLATKAYTVGFYYKPRIDIHMLREHKEGLIILSGCMQGLIPKMILANEMDMARDTIKDMFNFFGNNFYLEIQDTQVAGQIKINDALWEMSGIRHIVPTNDVHYLNKDDYKVHDALICIGTATNIYEQKRMHSPSDQMYLKSYDEMNEIFTPNALQRTIEIAERCNVNIELNRQAHITKPDVAFFVLKEICDEKIKEYNDNYKERYKIEIEAIQKVEYAEYLLVVADFVQYCKHNNIPIGSGRGSSAGSLVCYLLGITDIDPIQYGLIFERFINTERIEPPDIDIDICQARRDEVINYIKNEYGENRVAQIISFGTMKTKQAIKDTCRVLKIPFMVANAIIKYIPDSFDGSVNDALNIDKVKWYMDEHIDKDVIADLCMIASKIEGKLRHSSTHAAGVVISDVPLQTITPLCTKTNDNGLLTQYDMYAISKLGLLKFDILGLRTITLIDDACKLANINKNTIPLDDAYTFRMLSMGETYGVFQYAGWGYTRFIKQMQPKIFNDLIHLGALFRPGLLDSGMAQEYLNRRNENWKPESTQADIDYQICPDTYGIYLYQEQIMQAVVKTCNFTMNEADILRKAIGKKDKDLMDKMLGKIQNKTLADKIVTFARYGWNKAHAVSYALLSYQTAYLKYNYSAEFFCALLNSEIEVNEKIREILQEAARYKVIVKPPNINLSDIKYTMYNRQLYSGLLSIKGIGEKACQAILNERKTGIFTSAEDLRKRIAPKLLNSVAFKALENNGVFV